MIYWLIAITAGFLIGNFILARYDFFHPAVVLHAVFLVDEIVCAVCAEQFAIVFHPETVFVLVLGFSAFTLAHFFFRAKSQRRKTCPVKEIVIANSYTVALLIVQVLAVVFFIRYLRAISAAYGQPENSISEMINLYDIMTKFWTDLFRDLNVPVPMVYRVANPIAAAGAKLVLYKTVNNFVATKRVKLLDVLVILLDCVLIVLNGSRSPLFRLFTMALALFYILCYREGKIRQPDMRLLMKMLGAVILSISAMVALLYLMGRSEKMGNLRSYIFIYTGAPLVNLDTLISDGSAFIKDPSASFFGAQTLHHFYAYLGKLFNVPGLRYAVRSEFLFSPNGIEIGNVYTTFYHFLNDFSYAGVFPLMALIGTYYSLAYRRAKDRLNRPKIDFGLLIYAYLFNDLIMLSFSNRFFETTLDAPFLKILLFGAIMNELVFSHRLIKAKLKAKNFIFKW